VHVVELVGDLSATASEIVVEADQEVGPVVGLGIGHGKAPEKILQTSAIVDSLHRKTTRHRREQSELLASKLREAGGKVKTIHETDKNHMTINRELGQSGDEPTGEVFEFLEDVLEGE
jgi:hypothetical protein